MKRKLAASIKGTPPITKFFKRSSELGVTAEVVLSSDKPQRVSSTAVSARKNLLASNKKEFKVNIGSGGKELRKDQSKNCTELEVTKLNVKDKVGDCDEQKIGNVMDIQADDNLVRPAEVFNFQGEGYSIFNVTEDSKTASRIEEVEDISKLARSNKNLHSLVVNKDLSLPVQEKLTGILNNTREDTNCCPQNTAVRVTETADCKMSEFMDAEMETFDSNIAAVQKQNREEDTGVDAKKRDLEIGATLPSDAGKESMYREELSQDDEDSEDKSDDDALFSRSAFLVNRSVKPDVKTPEKCTTPLTGSPLTPTSPFEQRRDDESPKCRYPLSKLVLEKPKMVKKDARMASLQSAIHDLIEEGWMKRLCTDETVDEHEDDDEEILPVHQKELKQFTSENRDFSEEMPREDIFPGFKETIRCENGCSQPFPTLDTTDMDAFTKTLFQMSDVEIREVLCGGWILQLSLVGRCLPAVVQWLFHIMSYHLDNHTLQASYNVLWSMVNATESTNDGQSCLSWMPSIYDILCVCNNYGANIASQLPKVCKEVDVAGEFSASKFGLHGLPTKEEGTHCNSPFPLANFVRLIQLVTLCVSRSPRCYSTKDLEVLAVLLCCVSLDHRMELAMHNIKTCLEATYEAFDSSLWPEKAKKVSSIISGLQTHHRSKLYLGQMQPYSCRGRDVKRLVSIEVLASLIGNSLTHDELGDILRSSIDPDEKKEITETVKAFEKLEKLLNEVRISDDTDYYKLYTILELLDLAVGAESLLPEEKVILDRIAAKLRLLHSDIKDPRAMFIGRTKKSISAYFKDAPSDLCIETLKDEGWDDSTDTESEKSFGYPVDRCSEDSGGSKDMIGVSGDPTHTTFTRDD